MYSGVGKSGSPAPKPITGRPAALSAFALASTASVADSVMAETRTEMRPWAAVMSPSCHHRGAGRVIGDRGGSTAAPRATTLHPLVAVLFTNPVCQHGLTEPRAGRRQRWHGAVPAAAITGQ